MNFRSLYDMYRCFILVFGWFYVKVISCVFFWAFSETSLMKMCSFVFVFMHARMTDFTFTLHLFKFLMNQNQNLFIGWICDSLNQSGHGGVGLSVNNRSCLAQKDKCIGFFWWINVVKMWWCNHVRYGASEYPNETKVISLKRLFKA